ncbi:hypothetical protein M2275_004777 [Rhodococcus opacus]|nr:hypothetical protein [Rhodococcus opacus]
MVDESLDSSSTHGRGRIGPPSCGGYRVLRPLLRRGRAPRHQPGPLRLPYLIARHDPDSIAHRSTLAVADRDVWIRPAENGMAYLDGHLPAADAHTLAMRLREMSIHDVCADDPRTLPQRRADALTTLVPQALRAGRYPQIAPGTSRATAVGNSARPVSPPRGHGGHLSFRSSSTPRRSSDSTTFPPTSRDTGRSAPKYFVQGGTPSGLRAYIGRRRCLPAHPHNGHRRRRRWARPRDQSRSEDSRHTRDLHPEHSNQTRTHLRTGDGSRPQDPGPRRQLPLPQLPGPGAARDIDHTTPFDHPENGGLTVESNLACLCRRHHRLKTDGS